MELSKQEVREIADFLNLLYDMYKKFKNHSPGILAHIKHTEEKLKAALRD
jgi:hypothetical protein